MQAQKEKVSTRSSPAIFYAVVFCFFALLVLALGVSADNFSNNGSGGIPVGFNYQFANFDFNTPIDQLDPMLNGSAFFQQGGYPRPDAQMAWMSFIVDRPVSSNKVNEYVALNKMFPSGLNISQWNAFNVGGVIINATKIQCQNPFAPPQPILLYYSNGTLGLGNSCVVGSCDALNKSLSCDGFKVIYFFNTTTRGVEVLWVRDVSDLSFDVSAGDSLLTDTNNTALNISLTDAKRDSWENYDVENGTANDGSNVSRVKLTSTFSAKAVINVNINAAVYFDFSANTSFNSSNSNADVNFGNDPIFGTGLNVVVSTTGLPVIAQLPGTPNLADIFQAPPDVDVFTSYGLAKPISAGSVYIVKTKESRYTKFKVLSANATSLTIQYVYQNANSLFFGSSGGGVLVNDPCSDFLNQSSCTVAGQSGARCVWDFGQRKCRSDPNVGGSATGSGGGVGGSFSAGPVIQCPMFTPRIDTCQALAYSVCVFQNVSGDARCVNAANFSQSFGVQCSNITRSDVCENIPALSTSCTWNSSKANGSTSGCYSNFTKIKDVSMIPVGRCEDAGVNSTMCNNFAQLNFMPCQFNASGDGQCRFKASAVFGFGGTGGFFNIGDQNSCIGSGGSWVEKQYIDASGIQRFDRQCQPGFGNSQCSSNCMACEFQSNHARWSNVTIAQSQCEQNRTNGMSCSFTSFGGTQMPDGKWGACFPAAEFRFGGGNCNTECSFCFNNATCRSSTANCTFRQDPFTPTRGFCESGRMSAFFTTNCESLSFSQSSCQNAQSPLNCTWIANSGNASTRFGSDIGFRGCANAGAAGSSELCMVPGDEDNNGLADCADPACSQHPACGFGFAKDSGGNVLNSTQLGLGINCGQFDNTNQTACETFNNNASLTGSCSYRTVNTPIGQKSFCGPRMDKFMKGDMITDAPPTPIGSDVSNDSAGQSWLDIRGVGIHDSPKSLDIGIPITNLTNFAGCNKQYTNSANNTGKYYRFIDIDSNVSGGCVGTLANGTNVSGFEFRVDYIENATSSATIKQVYSCVANAWVLKPEARVSVISDSCYVSEMINSPVQSTGAQIVLIDKNGINNPKGNLRILVSTANASTSLTNPIDSAGPFFYTIGSVDFKPRDCTAVGQDTTGSGFTSENDPACQGFLQNGFVDIERGAQCGDGIDNDGNGLTDCNDANCKYNSFFCGSTGFTLANPDTADKTAPAVSTADVTKYPDSSAVMWTNNEPSNASVDFFNTDAKCAVVNSTVVDPSLLNNDTSDDFRPWHKAFLSQQYLGFNLTPNSTYYYKMLGCDASGNCGKSSCLNFTTAASTNTSDCPQCTFTVQLSLPRNVTVSFDYNNNGNYSDDVENNSMTYGLSLNYTQGKNITTRLHSDTQNWSITLHGVDLVKTPTSSVSNFSSSLLYNNTGSGVNSTYVGMSTDQWERVAQYFGGISSVDLTIPQNGSNLRYCSETNLSNCQTLNATKLSASSTESTWRVPVTGSTGFSQYNTVTVSTAVASSASTPASSSSGSSGGSSGGGSSSGGGGVATSTTSQTKSVLSVVADTPVSLAFTAKDVPVSTVEVTLNTGKTSIALTVSKLDSLPSYASVISAKVYSYLEFNKSSFINDEIKSAKVVFSVNKSWISANALADNTVALHRFTTQWDALPTVIKSSDATTVTYEAVTPGFSLFAIGEKKVAPAVLIAPPVTATAPESAPVVVAPETKVASALSSGWILWLVFAVIVVAIVLLLLKKRRN